jgi:hypothetical protein
VLNVPVSLDGDVDSAILWNGYQPSYSGSRPDLSDEMDPASISNGLDNRAKMVHLDHLQEET